MKESNCYTENRYNVEESRLTTPQVSVIVPVYNVSRYVWKCLQSIAVQSYENLEIVIVDDGSTDNSGKLCDVMANVDERVKVVHTQNNGLSAARNLGILLSRGDYILFVDSDDWIEPHAVSTLVNEAILTESDIVVCRYVMEWVGESSVPQPEPAAMGVLSGQDAVNAIIDTGFISESAWAKLFQRKLLSQFEFKVGMLCEDVEGVWRIIDCADRVCCIEYPMYHYRMRQNSIMHSLSRQMLTDHWNAFISRYHALAYRSPELYAATMRGCIKSAIYVWSHQGLMRPCDRASISSLTDNIEAFFRTSALTALSGREIPFKYKLALLIICLGCVTSPICQLFIGNGGIKQRGNDKHVCYP